MKEGFIIVGYYKTDGMPCHIFCDTLEQAEEFFIAQKEAQMYVSRGGGQRNDLSEKAKTFLEVSRTSTIKVITHVIRAYCPVFGDSQS